MTEHVYDESFYNYLDSGSRSSARQVSSLILAEIPIKSLLDVGSGHGAWATEWLSAGVPDVLAVDGEYVSPSQLLVPRSSFHAHDLLVPLFLPRRFDLVQSLEVAEHLPADKAAQFVDSLVRHGDIVLFSAAVPYQGGEHHVNEQPPEYWRQLFFERGYEVFDWLRPLLAHNSQVKRWYRFNSFLYANKEGQDRLTAPILKSRVPSERPLRVDGDLLWFARRVLVRLIPSRLVKPVAIAKAKMEVWTKSVGR